MMENVAHVKTNTAYGIILLEKANMPKPLMSFLIVLLALLGYAAAHVFPATTAGLPPKTRQRRLHTELSARRNSILDWSACFQSIPGAVPEAVERSR